MNRASLSAIAAPRGLVGGPFGSSLVNADYVETGIPVIRGTNMSHGRYIGGKFAFVSSEKYTRDLSRNSAVARDVVFTQRGTLGQVALVPCDETDVYIVSQSQMRFRADRTKCVPEFVYYAATSADFLRQIDDRAIATGVPHTNLGILSQLEISLPPLPEQQAIAEVLGALDDKIAANTALASTTETLLRAEADSVWLQREGRESTLADYIDLNPPNPKPSGDEPLYVDMKKLPESGWSIDAPDRRAAKGGARFRRGDTLLARITPCLENRKTGFVDNIDEGEIAIGSTEFIVLRARGELAPPIAFLLATEARFREFAIQNMIGTSGRQRVAAADLARFELPRPDETWLAEFGARSVALFAQVESLRKESHTLAATRDALLPKLMSGKLRVRDVERLASEADA